MQSERVLIIEAHSRGKIYLSFLEFSSKKRMNDASADLAPQETQSTDQEVEDDSTPRVFSESESYQTRSLFNNMCINFIVGL